jgi:hypothetical protein
LCGGPFDGYRQALEQMPSRTRFEIPTVQTRLPASNFSSSHLAVYERHQVIFARLNGVPAMVLKYGFVGMTATETRRSAIV